MQVLHNALKNYRTPRNAVNQADLPELLLDMATPPSDVVTAGTVIKKVRQKFPASGISEALLSRIRASLAEDCGRYLNLTAVAKRNLISTRTLKRRLQERGLSYQILLNERRRQDSMELLDNPDLSIEEVAARVGYSSAANFTRAFRKWTGSTPGAYRASLANTPLPAP